MQRQSDTQCRAHDSTRPIAAKWCHGLQIKAMCRRHRRLHNADNII